MWAVLTVGQRIRQRKSPKGLLDKREYLNLNLNGHYEANEKRAWQQMSLPVGEERSPK